MIRVLKASDKEDVIHLVQQTNNFSASEIEIAKELIDICIEKPTQTDYYAFVAIATDATNTVAGFLLLGPTPATVGTYDMYWIAVDPEFQGRGFAQELDTFAEQFVRERKGYWLIAETSSQSSYERTRAFYAKQGYKILATIEDYYKPSDDLVIYGKRLRT